MGLQQPKPPAGGNPKFPNFFNGRFHARQTTPNLANRKTFSNQRKSRETRFRRGQSQISTTPNIFSSCNSLQSVHLPYNTLTTGSTDGVTTAGGTRRR